MTNDDLRKLEVDVEYYFTDGNYYNRLKISLDQKNKRVYCIKPQFGHDNIWLTPCKKSQYYCKASISIAGFYLREEYFDLEKWSVTKIESELYKDYLRLWNDRISSPTGMGTQCKHPYELRKKYGQSVSNFKEDHGNDWFVTDCIPFNLDDFKEKLFNDEEFKESLVTVLKL